MKNATTTPAPADTKADTRRPHRSDDIISRDLHAWTPLSVGETRVERVSTGYRATTNVGAPFYCVDGWGPDEASALAEMRARVEGFEAVMVRAADSIERDAPSLSTCGPASHDYADGVMSCPV